MYVHNKASRVQQEGTKPRADESLSVFSTCTCTQLSVWLHVAVHVLYHDCVVTPRTAGVGVFCQEIAKSLISGLANLAISPKLNIVSKVHIDHEIRKVWSTAIL